MCNNGSFTEIVLFSLTKDEDYNIRCKLKCHPYYYTPGYPAIPIDVAIH